MGLTRWCAGLDGPQAVEILRRPMGGVGAKNDALGRVWHLDRIGAGQTVFPVVMEDARADLAVMVVIVIVIEVRSMTGNDQLGEENSNSDNTRQRRAHTPRFIRYGIAVSHTTPDPRLY